MDKGREMSDAGRCEFDPHPALRATLSQWERDGFQVIPSPFGRGWREAPGEGRIHNAIRFPTFFFFILLVLFSGTSFAQQRPLITEDPRLISDGSLVTELGFTYLDRARFPLSRLEGNELSAFDGGLNFGLGSRAEFQMRWVGQNFLWVRNNGGRRNDFGDLSLSTKIRIIDEKGRRPIISFRPTIVLPNSNDAKGIGTNTTQFFGNILWGKTIGRAFVFGNIGLGILEDPVRLRSQQDVLTYGLAAVIPIGSRFNLVSEWNGQENAQEFPSPGGEDHGQIRLGLQFRAAGIRWDAAGLAGLTSRDPRAGIVFGLTKEFLLWK